MNGKLLAVAALAAVISGPTVSTVAIADDATGECHGVNSCKGTGACGGAGHSCAGKNSCKGQGWLKTTEKECKDKGGKFKKA